jgi:hypothetical protein
VNEPPDVDATVQRIEKLLEEFEQSAGPQARERAGELVGLLMNIYGAGLSRLIEILGASTGMVERVAEDRLLASLLLLHGLHPESMETRIRRALQRVERGLEAQHVVLDGLEAGVARVRIEKNGGVSRWPAEALASIIERAVVEAAPDVEGLEIDGLESGAALVQIAPAPGA